MSIKFFNTWKVLFSSIQTQYNISIKTKVKVKKTENTHFTKAWNKISQAEITTIRTNPHSYTHKSSKRIKQTYCHTYFHKLIPHTHTHFLSFSAFICPKDLWTAVVFRMSMVLDTKEKRRRFLRCARVFSLRSDFNTKKDALRRWV